MNLTSQLEGAAAHVCAHGPVSVSVSGSPLRFETVYRDYREQVSRFARALGTPEAYREDVVHDVFVVVHRRLGSFDGQNLQGWLFQITRRRVRDLRCGAWFRRVFSTRQGVPDHLAATHGPADSLETKQGFELVERHLQRLSEHERLALLLFELDGYSGDEIAEIQGVSPNTVFSRLRRARCKLESLAAKRWRAEQHYLS